MVDEVTLQPGYARKPVVRAVNKKFPSRYVYSTVLDAFFLFRKLMKLHPRYGNSGSLKVTHVNLSYLVGLLLT